MKPKRTCLRLGCDHTDCEKGMKQEICENKNCFCGAPKKVEKQLVTISVILEEFDKEFMTDGHGFSEKVENKLKDFIRSFLEAVVDEMVLQKKILMDKWTLEHATIGLQEEDMRKVGFNEAVEALNAKREEIRK